LAARTLPLGGSPGKLGGRRNAPTTAEAEQIAILALAHIAADSDRLGRFVALTGIEPDGLRAAAASPGFFRAVLDHIAGHEPDLLAFAAEAGIAPERISAAHQALSADEHWSG
jgi:hypothetical protein